MGWMALIIRAPYQSTIMPLLFRDLVDAFNTLNGPPLQYRRNSYRLEPPLLAHSTHEKIGYCLAFTEISG